MKTEHVEHMHTQAEIEKELSNSIETPFGSFTYVYNVQKQAKCVFHIRYAICEMSFSHAYGGKERCENKKFIAHKKFGFRRMNDFSFEQVKTEPNRGTCWKMLCVEVSFNEGVAYDAIKCSLKPYSSDSSAL